MTDDPNTPVVDSSLKLASTPATLHNEEITLDDH